MEPKTGGIICNGAVLGVHALCSLIFLILAGMPGIIGYLFRSFWAMPFLEVVLCVAMLVLFIQGTGSDMTKLVLFIIALVAAGLQVLCDISFIWYLVQMISAGGLEGNNLIVVIVCAIFNVVLTIALLLNVKFANDIRKSEA
eukprot:sb/3474184/